MVRGQGSSMDCRRHPEITRPRELPLLRLRRMKSHTNTDEPVTRDAYEEPRKNEKATNSAPDQTKPKKKVY